MLNAPIPTIQRPAQVLLRAMGKKLRTAATWSRGTRRAAHLGSHLLGRGVVVGEEGMDQSITVENSWNASKANSSLKVSLFFVVVGGAMGDMTLRIVGTAPSPS